MKKYWKQLEELVTGLRSDLFVSARLRLTVYYLLIMTTVLVVFSIVLYFSFAQVLRENMDTQFPDVPDQGDQAVVQTMSDAKDGIVIIDLTAFALTIVLSYSLAGKTLQPIKEAMEKQKEFSSNASHELRTPLAIMKTDSEVALKNPDSGKVEMRTALESNLEEINRMAKMVDNLLKLSRFESKNQSHCREVDLGKIVLAVVGRIKPLAENKCIEIKVGNIGQAKVLGSHEYLELMISNLLQNAVNYNKRDGKVEIGVASQENLAKITVRDNGQGIPKADLPHVFERFYKADKNRSQNNSGAGVGLSIVKDIVEKHSGSIEIQSSLGEGTEVVIALPSAA